MMECKGMGSVHSGFYGALFNGDEEQGRLFDDLVGSIRSADEGKAKAIYLTGSPALSISLIAQVLACLGDSVKAACKAQPLLKDLWILSTLISAQRRHHVEEAVQTLTM